MNRPFARILLVSVLDMNILLFRRELILALQEQGVEVHVCVPRGAHRSALEELGLQLHTLPIQRGSLRPQALWRALQGMRQALLQARPDVVHSFTHQANLLAGLAVPGPACGHVQTPPPPSILVQTISGLGAAFINADLKSRLVRRLVQRGYRRRVAAARAMVFQNPDDLQLFTNLGLTAGAEPLVIRGSGVDLQRFRPDRLCVAGREAARAALGIGPQRVVVTMAARLLRDKGVPDLVAAARQLESRRPEALFLLVGGADPGNPSSLDHRELAELRALPNLVLAGWQADMPRIWGLSDIAVLPSRREGLPVSLQEAMACGLPLVTADVPGCREAVEQGVNGMLVESGDAEALASALDELVSDPDKRRVMGRAGRDKACREFDGARLAREQMALYDRLLANA